MKVTDNIVTRRRTRSNATEKSEYEIYCENKITRNREYLKRLGLDQPILGRQKNKRMKKSTPEVIAAPKIVRTPRRSSRLLNANEQESIDEVTEFNEEASVESLPRPRRRRVVFKMQNLPTEEDRNKLKTIKTDEVLNDVAYYMKVHLKNSEMNIKNVKKTLKNLFNGDGVKHQSSRRRGHIFKQGEHISLADDINKLLDEESDWIAFHGKDVSNGWLVRHPLRKLMLYQIARIEKGEAFSTSSTIMSST